MTERSETEISISALLALLWHQKWISLLACTGMFSAALIWSSFQPDMYRAYTLVAPVNDGSTASLTSQYGGLASLAGISMPQTQISKSDKALRLIKSRNFFATIDSKYKISADLIALKAWDRDTEKLTYDAGLWSTVDQEWKLTEAELGEIIPSSEVHELFLKALNISVDKEKGFITISAAHISPNIAKKWVDVVLLEINELMRQLDMTEASKAINYLKGQAEKNSVTDLDQVFFNLIEQQMQIMLLSQIRDEYVFTVLDPAETPDKPYEPNRILNSILAGIAGLIIGICAQIGLMMIKR